MGGQPNHIEGRGNFVQMKRPCRDCGKKWGMYESEMDFYNKLINTKGYRMPSRCSDCRKKKKEAMEKGIVPLDIVSNEVFKMAKKAKEGAYTFHEEVLEKELREIGDKLNLYIKQNRMMNDEQSESVQEHTES
jgi:transcriptional regulator NrdR family protein